MHSLETLKKLNAEAQARQLSKAEEKRFILQSIEEAVCVNDLKNILVYVVDRYVLKEDKDGCHF